MTLAEARSYLAADCFDGGSRRSKVQAVVDFEEATVGQAVITNLPNLFAAVSGKAGMQVVRNGDSGGTT